MQLTQSVLAFKHKDVQMPSDTTGMYIDKGLSECVTISLPSYSLLKYIQFTYMPQLLVLKMSPDVKKNV